MTKLLGAWWWAPNSFVTSWQSADDEKSFFVVVSFLVVSFCLPVCGRSKVQRLYMQMSLLVSLLKRKWGIWSLRKALMGSLLLPLDHNSR